MGPPLNDLMLVALLDLRQGVEVSGKDTAIMVTDGGVATSSGLIYIYIYRSN